VNKAVNASAVAMSNYNRLDAEIRSTCASRKTGRTVPARVDASNEDCAQGAGQEGGNATAGGFHADVRDQRGKPAETLKQQVIELKHKIDEAERTATTLVARKNAAQAQRKVPKRWPAWANADNAFAALNRFEETVAKEEASAQAFNQLASAGKDDDLEKEFAALQGHSVDDELQALKRERSKPPTIPTALPAPARAQRPGRRAISARHGANHFILVVTLGALLISC